VAAQPVVIDRVEAPVLDAGEVECGAEVGRARNGPSGRGHDRQLPGGEPRGNAARWIASSAGAMSGVL
jgi:hypothetical protein